MDFPDILDACVIGVPHEYNGEVPLAYVVLIPSASQRISRDPVAARKIKRDIIKVQSNLTSRY